MQKKSMYKIIFINQGKVYEVYAKEIVQSDLYGFIEAKGFVFGEKSSLVIDPSEERLKNEFSEVNRTYIPMHSIVRIDEVKKEGTAKIIPIDGKNDHVLGFPSQVYTNKDDPKDDRRKNDRCF